MENLLPVSFVPSQIDTFASSTPLPFRGSPMRLLFSDLLLVLSLIAFTPWIFIPVHTTNKYSELYLRDFANIRDLLIHVVLGVIGLAWFILVLPVFILFPGLAFLAFNTVFYLVVWAITTLLNHGDRIFESDVDLGDAPKYPGERWLYINGIDCGKHWLKANVNMIAETFKRPVLGIHNRSLGSVLDLLECLIQRCFCYTTEDTRIVYQYMKEQLMDDKVKKCVVLAHSQGGIILSNVLDLLFADIPHTHMEKLEIYTFGNAANHFNNPIRSPGERIAPTNETDGTRLIRHIEHYCNEWDFVAQFGSMRFCKNPPDNRFVGRMFVRKGFGGHLMNMHYLDKMFPIDESLVDTQFLDQVVLVDEDVAAGREEAAVEQGYLGQKHVESKKSSAENPDRAEERTVLKRAGTDLASRNAKRQKGKTVRDLSRLWRYRGGGKVED